MMLPLHLCTLLVVDRGRDPREFARASWSLGLHDVDVTPTIVDDKGVCCDVTPAVVDDTGG